MTAEVEVCNGAVHEVDGTEEKREFKAGSIQDPAKPEIEGIENHDQADDSEDSYILVTDVGEPCVDSNDMAAVDGSPTHESSAPGELSGMELDGRTGNSEGGNVGKHGNAEAGDAAAEGSSWEEPCALGEHLVIELEARPDLEVISIGDGGVNQDNTVEEENKCSEELNDGEDDPTLREGEIENAGSTDKNLLVADGVLVGVEGSLLGAYEIQDKLAVNEPECEVESETKKDEGSNGSSERSEEAEFANKLTVIKPECEDESEIKKAECSNGKIERYEEAEVANKPVSKPEVEAESEIEKDESSNVKIERSEAIEVARFEDQNGEIGVVEVQDQKCDIDPKNDGQYELDEDKVVDGTADCNVEIGSGQVLEGKEESYSEPEASGPTKEQSVVHKHKNEVQISDSETAEVISSLPVDGSESESFLNEPIHPDNVEMCTISGVSDSAIKTVVSNEMEPISHGSELIVDSEPVSAAKLGPESHNSSNEVASKSMLESADVEVVVDGATRSDDQNLLLAKNVDTCSLKPISDAADKEDVNGVPVSKPFNYFVRLPRYSDEKLQEQIRIAEQEVKDKTKLRDSIQAQIQEIRAKNQNNGIDYEHAKGEDRSLKKLVKEKRMEIDSLQSVINKAKNATSIEDLNSRIKTIEHMIQHETLPLKEEKQLIHEIKQLKQLREQLSSNKCSQNEIQQALEQRELAEERLKTLRKELGNLKGTASKAQTVCNEVEHKYNEEYKKVKELQAQFRVADDIRQEAYVRFLSLSKELSQKRKNFFKVKNDSAAATHYAFTDDRKSLYRHCVNEVENFMELWNENEEFRSEYVRLNTRSTVRRFGTSDGRSLGPDEKPTILPSYVGKRNDKVVSVPANTDSRSKTPTLELKTETKIENVSLDIHSNEEETKSKVKAVTTGGPAKSKQLNSLVTDSGMDEEKVEMQKEPVKTKEELELIRKAEEIRREEAEAKLKEQRRLEEIVKAKEARERKQRRDEKAQKREELKARKEAEQKEKEREKKSRKKERKAASSTSTPMDVQDDASSITCVEISKEEASTQVSDGSTKKTKTNRVIVSKQNKTRSAPPPSLRNRNRRKWRQWMWVIVVSLAVIVLFWLGNLGVFSSVHSRLQGTGY